MGHCALKKGSIMTIEQHIANLRTNPSDREQERIETYNSIKEMELTLGSLLVVEVQASAVIVTK